MSTTIKDVAQLAGVSKALVSRYLNGKAGVSEASRKRIVEAINELHYTPNALARSLVTQKTYSIGVLLELMDSDVAFSLIKGLELGVQGAPDGSDYTLIYTSSFGDLERKKRQLTYLTQGRADGVIIFGSQIYNDELIIRLSKGWPRIRQGGFRTLFPKMPQLSDCQISINVESRQDFLGMDNPKPSFFILMNISADSHGLFPPNQNASRANLPDVERVRRAWPLIRSHLTISQRRVSPGSKAPAGAGGERIPLNIHRPGPDAVRRLPDS